MMVNIRRRGFFNGNFRCKLLTNEIISIKSQVYSDRQEELQRYYRIIKGSFPFGDPNLVDLSKPSWFFALALD